MALVRIFNRFSIVALLMLLLTPFQAQAEFTPSQKLSVMVRDVKLRKSPSHWSPSLADLKYGDSVTVVVPSDSWLEVALSTGVQGYLHTSAVSSRQVILKAGVQVAEEQIEPTNVVLAGKGFNQDVEDLYGKQESQLDYKAIDSWERTTIPDSELEEFISAGGLSR